MTTTNSDSQLQSLETRVNHGAEVAANQLAQLIQLITTSTTLQERDKHKDESIKELTVFITEVKKSHKDAEKLNKDSSDLVHEKVRVLRVDFEQSNIKGLQDHESQKALQSKFNALDEDYKAKNNFMKGVVWLLSFVLVAGQGLVYSYYQDVTDSISKIEGKIEKQLQIKQEDDQQIQIIQQQIRDLRNSKGG